KTPEWLKDRPRFFPPSQAHQRTRQFNTTPIPFDNDARRQFDGLSCDPFRGVVPPGNSQGECPVPLRETLHEGGMSLNETNGISAQTQCLTRVTDHRSHVAD